MSTFAQPAFPDATGRALSGAEFRLPDDLPAAFNLVIVAFDREQQPAVDTWIPALEELEKARPDFAFLEFPVIKRMNPLMRWVIHQGMRSGIKDEEARTRTVTFHLAKEPFKKALGIEDENHIHVLLADREGRILWRASGEHAPAKEAALREQLPPPAAGRRNPGG